MTTSVFDDFLTHTDRAAHELAADSDVLTLHRRPLPGAGLWLAEYALSYLAQSTGGAIYVHPGPLVVAIRFDASYLRSVSPLDLVQVREPDLFHPNHLPPVLCVGDVQPGTPLPYLLRHVYEILSYQNFAADDGLNPIACARLRDEPGLLDLLPRPPRLVRRRLELVGEETKT